MNTVILYAYITLAAAGGPWGKAWWSEWQNIGQFRTIESCQEAIKQLGQPNKMRCVKQ